MAYLPSAENIQRNQLLEMNRGEHKAMPRNQLLGYMADAALRAKQHPVGEFFLGEAPEALDNISYGMPNHTGTGMATTLNPGVADLAFVGPDMKDVMSLGVLGVMGAVKKAGKPDYVALRAEGNENRFSDGAADYRGQHTAPYANEYHARLDDLTKIYPDDIYSTQAARYYGDSGGDQLDAAAVSVLQSVRGNPEALVTVYRAVPHEASNTERISHIEKQMSRYLKTGKSPDDDPLTGSEWYENAHEWLDKLSNAPEPPLAAKQINARDWVTPSREYAKRHGIGALNGQYKIISKKVRAKHLYTDGNSVFELGYDPVDNHLGDYE